MAHSSADAIVARSPWYPLPSLPVLVGWIALLALGAGAVSAVFDRDRLGMKPAALKMGVRETVLRTITGVTLWAVFLLAVMVFALTLAAQPIVPGMAGFLHMPSARLLLVLCLLWMLARTLTPVSKPLAVERYVSPAGVFRLDRRASLLPVAVRRACWMALVWLCFGPYTAAAYGLYAAVRLLCVVLLGSVRTASGRFADARVWLACRRRMPARPMAFLTDAHRRGALRQMGASYQFRHIRLQQRLSVQHPRWSPCPTSLVAALLRRLEGLSPLTESTRLPLSNAPWTEPNWAFHFRRATAGLSPAAGVGTPAGGVRRIVPGFAQDYNSAGGQHDWVLCALPGDEPVFVARPVWAAARQAGAGAGEDALAAVGYPVMSGADPTAPPIIPADAERVEMAGGSWGRGLLVRDGQGGPWHWEPAESFGPPSPWLGADHHGPHRGVSRIRVTATLPWAAPGLAITPAAGRKMQAEILSSRLAGIFAGLSAQWGGTLAEKDPWQPAHGQEARKCHGYVCPAAKPDGSLAARADVRLSLVHQEGSTIVAAHTELRIPSPGSWPPAAAAGSGRGARADDPRLRLSLDELLVFLTEAWHMVTEVLPMVIVSDPAAMPLADCPYVRWELWAAQHDDPAAPSLSLLDVVDFSPFQGGEPARLPPGVPGPPSPGLARSIVIGPPQPDMMWITIRGPLRLSYDDRTARARQALVHMARQHGFPNAQENWREARP